MKKLLILSILIFSSCQKNCDEEKEQVTKQYYNAIAQSGFNQTAIDKLTREYNSKINELNNRCE
jgi:hypothetical protein